MKKQDKVKAYFTKDHTDILYGVTTVVNVFIIAEIFTKVITAIFLTVNLNNSVISFIVFLSALIYILPVIVSICYVIYDYKTECSTNDNQGSKKDTKRNDVIFKLFVCAVAYFVYIILYSFFPAFILAFAYPIRLISIFTFMLAFMALSTVCITTYVKFIQKLDDKYKGRKRAHKVSKLCYSICLTVVLICFFLFIFALLYSLIIGRASVATSAPLAVLSLLPSILISLAAWVIKSTLLTHTDSEKKKKSEQNDTDDNQRTEEKSDDTGPKHIPGQAKEEEREKEPETAAAIEVCN